jgi:hypothetical protein
MNCIATCVYCCDAGQKLTGQFDGPNYSLLDNVRSGYIYLGYNALNPVLTSSIAPCYSRQARPGQL